MKLSMTRSRIREAEVFLALEVVIEVAFANPARGQDIVERGVLVTLEMDEAGGRLDHDLAGRLPFPGSGRGLDHLFCTN